MGTIIQAKRKACLAYLKEAKQKQLTIDTGDLMQRFKLDLESVKYCMSKVF